MKKIGIIDSGVGGLTILSQLMEKNLASCFLYISDENNVPYGEKSQTFMLKQMKSMTLKLLDKNVDGILIACNTATAETIDKLRNSFDIPFVGIEPYLNYINKYDVHNSSVGLILTEATHKSQRFQQLLKQFDPSHRIKIFPLKHLATNIERLKKEPFDKMENDLNTELDPLKKENLDLLILGCTHYPIISHHIENRLNLKTIDPSENVINQLIKCLDLNKGEGTNQEFYYNPDNSHKWLKTDIKVLSFL